MKTGDKVLFGTEKEEGVVAIEGTGEKLKAKAVFHGFNIIVEGYEDEVLGVLEQIFKPKA
jgi:hypothetical protein